MSNSILIADTSTTILNVMSYIFENQGYNVIISNSVEDLFEKIDNNIFNIAMIDITFDSLKTVEKIKNSQNSESIIYIFSEKEDIKLKKQLKEAGVYGWITKPFIPEKLAKIISSSFIPKI